MRISLSAVALLYSLTALACGAPSNQSEYDESADRETLNEMLDQFDAAVNAGELGFLASHYTADAVRMPHGSPALVGIEAVQEWFETMRDQYAYDVDNTFDEINFAGDWAFARGSATVTQTPRDGGEPISGTSKWMAVFQRQPDGTWRTYWDMFNSDAP